MQWHGLVKLASRRFVAAGTQAILDILCAGRATRLNFRRTLTVFIGSPGGLSDERSAVQATIEEMNRLVAHRAGYHLDVVRWEDSVAGFGNPQQRLNQELDRSDLFIGMLNRNWGSPPAGDSNATSGFEEEYRRSLKRRQSSGAPEMMVLFQTVPPDILRDPGPDLQKVMAFRQELDSAKPVFYKVFDGVQDLQQQLRAYLAAWLHGLGETENPANREDVAEPATTPAVSHDGAHRVFSPQGAVFLAAAAKAERENGMLLPAEVARLRLLGFLSHTSSNDARVLDVHDANLLYSECSPSMFGDDEVDGLISAGLDHYVAKTAPLWTWLMHGPEDPAVILSNAAILRSRASERVGAISALNFIGGDLRSAMFTRETLVDLLLDGSENRDVRAATFRYLSDHGGEADLPALWTAQANGAAGQIDEATAAILSVLARIDCVKAFRALIDLTPSNPSHDVVDQIFAAADALPAEWIAEALSHRSAYVRLAAFQMRHRLPDGSHDWARALTRDVDPDVRAAAVAAIEASGEALSPDDVRNILVKSTRNALLGFGAPTAVSGSAQWAFYRRQSIQRWSEDQQRRAVERDKDAWTLLTLAGVAEKPGLLRAVVDVKGMIELKVPDMVGETARTPSTEEHALSLYVQAVDGLASLREAEDLDRIREAFADTRVELTEASYAYLGARGDWSDTGRIVAATQERRGTPPPTLMSFTDRRTEYGWAAAALIALGRDAWLQLLALNPAPPVLRRLVLEVPQKTWAGIDNSLLLQLFGNADESVREATALRCVRDLSIKRMKVAFDHFQAHAQSRYYSVIHWLDFGMAAPRTVSVSAARRKLDTLRQQGGLLRH